MLADLTALQFGLTLFSGWMAGTLLAIWLSCGAACRAHAEALREERRRAIAAGAAEYHCDPETGAVEFRYKEAKRQ